jgi:O-antigen ligase
MFSLIITIISIALVTALALATIYYGGSAFKQGNDAATAARLINEGQQLSGAAAVASANNQATTLEALKANNYMASVPAGWVDGAGQYEVTTGAPACAEVNKKAGLGETVVQEDISNYGCITADSKMVFKF